MVVFHTTDHPTVEQWSLSNTYVLGDANHKTSQNYATNFGHAVAIDTDNLYVSSPHYDQAGVTGEITIFTRGPGEEWKDSANLIIRKLGANNFPANCDLCCNSNCLGYPGTWETQYDMDAYQFADVGERFAHGASLETSLDVVVVTVGAYVPDTNDYGSVYLFGYEDENDPEGFMFGLFINTEPPTTQSPGSSSSSASTYNPGAGWFGSSAKYTIFNDQYIMAISYYGMNTVNIYYSDESTWTEIRHTPDAQLFSSFASDSVMFGYSIAFHENTLLVSDPYAYLNSGGSGPRFGLVEGFVLSTVYQKWSSMLVLDGWSVSSTQEEGSTYQGQSIDFDGSVFMMTTSNVILSSKLDCKDDCLSCYEDPTYSQCVDAYDSCDVVLACNGDCLNGGVCDVVYNKCNCTATAFKGNYCETQKTDPCTVQDCSQNGDCEADSTLTDFTCVCDHTWSGETCDRSECGSAACGEFGSCSGGVVGAYMCTCDEGWTTGADQYLCDELAFCWGTATCENGGVCTQGACNCAGTGFSGEVCDTPLSYSGDDYGVDYSYNDASTAADDTYSGSGQSDFVARPGSDDGSDGLASSSSSSSSSSEDDSSTTGVSTFTSSPAGEDAGEEIVTVDIVLTNKQMDCSAFVDIDACVNALPEMLAESFDGTTQHDFVIDTNQLILSEDGILFINLTFSGNTTETVEELEDQIQASAIFVEDTTSADLSDDGSAETSTDGSAMMIVLVAAALIFASGIGLTYIMMKKRNGASKVYVNGTKSKPKKMVMPV